MVTPISENEIFARQREQEADVYFRTEFLHASVSTQQKIISLLAKMESMLGKGTDWKAQIYFFSTTNKHKRSPDGDYTDRHGVDWQEVRVQIMHFCFSDHDMDGYTIVPRRVGQALTIFRSLTELPRKPQEFG